MATARNGKWREDVGEIAIIIATMQHLVAFLGRASQRHCCRIDADYRAERLRNDTFWWIQSVQGGNDVSAL